MSQQVTRRSFPAGRLSPNALENASRERKKPYRLISPPFMLPQETPLQVHFNNFPAAPRLPALLARPLRWQVEDMQASAGVRRPVRRVVGAVRAV